ncbi:MAG: recombination protein RecR [Syntrophomonadaceae bacterium]|nr:recombination protein RecR [Syntrophomonadaceae bacterium]
MKLAQPLQVLIDELLKLPTIGPKSAQRLAMFILKLSDDEARQLAFSIIDAKRKVFPCPICGYLTELSPCLICTDPHRDDTLLCITEGVSDVMAIERTGFNGRYFVLNKEFTLLKGSDIEQIDVKTLQEQIAKGAVQEVLLALNPDIDGEVLARYLARVIAPYGVKVTRLAHGLPVGGDIEYTDEITLKKAIEGRKEF